MGLLPIPLEGHIFSGCHSAVMFFLTKVWANMLLTPFTSMHLSEDCPLLLMMRFDRVWLLISVCVMGSTCVIFALMVLIQRKNVTGWESLSMSEFVSNFFRLPYLLIPILLWAVLGYGFAVASFPTLVFAVNFNFTFEWPGFSLMLIMDTLTLLMVLLAAVEYVDQAIKAVKALQ